MIKKQMEMFDEGGLEQDGGTVDPVSGNDVPVGSTQEEVRDDIDARLSEGEFVFPADVVRFIGLNNLMEMRQQAKAGLKKMEAMGQMGNSDEATMPDDIPFSSEDITVEDDDGNEGDLEMNVGGVVYQPSQVGSQFNIAPQQQQMYQPPMYQPMPQQQTGYLPSFGMQPQQPQQYTGFQSLIPMPTQKYENVSYINKTTGETMVIPHVGGKPTFDPPEGFTKIKAGEEAPKEEAKVDEELDTSVPTATVTKEYDKERDATSPENMKKAKEDMNKSYDNTFKLALEQSPDKSLEGITKFIKDGNVKTEVLGFEIKMPGFAFNEQGISDAYYRAYDEEMDTSGVKTGTKIKTDDEGKIVKPDFATQMAMDKTAEKEVASASKPKASPTTTKSADELRQAEMDRRQEEAEANRAAARQKARDEFKQDLKEQRSQGNVSAQLKGGRAGGDMFNKGGIASKPKKKAMKRGGLASKK